MSHHPDETGDVRRSRRLQRLSPIVPDLLSTDDNTNNDINSPNGETYTDATVDFSQDPLLSFANDDTFNQPSTQAHSESSTDSSNITNLYTEPPPHIATHAQVPNESHGSTSIIQVGQQIVTKHGMKALFRGVLMRSIVLGIGSSIFWPIQRTTSHYLQPDYIDPNFHDRLEEF